MVAGVVAAGAHAQVVEGMAVAHSTRDAFYFFFRIVLLKSDEVVLQKLVFVIAKFQL